MGGPKEKDARAHLEKNREKFRRLREQLDNAAKGAEDPGESATILGPKDELAYRRMKRELDEQGGEDE